MRPFRRVGKRLGQAMLDGDGAAQGFARALEGDEEAIALAAVDMAAEAGGLLLAERIVAAEDRTRLPVAASPHLSGRPP
jgi:hypothetical protein